MNLLKLLSLLLPSYTPQSGDDTREVLRDYPGCGQLGDKNKKECFWSCGWGPNPAKELDVTGLSALLYDKLEDLGMCQALFKVYF